MKIIPDKTKTTFRCPICLKNIEIGEWGKSPWPDEFQGTGSTRLEKGDLQSRRNMEYRLSNKRFHMSKHREWKRKQAKKVRTARRQAAVDRL